MPPFSKKPLTDPMAPPPGDPLAGMFPPDAGLSGGLGAMGVGMQPDDSMGLMGGGDPDNDPAMDMGGDMDQDGDIPYDDESANMGGVGAAGPMDDPGASSDPLAGLFPSPMAPAGGFMQSQALESNPLAQYGKKRSMFGG